MPDLAQILAAATLREETVRLCVNGRLNGEYQALDEQLKLARAETDPGRSLADGDPGADLAERMRVVHGQMLDATFPFTFRALPAKVWSDLQAQHPPRDGRNEKFNPETFPAALISASAVDPELTPSQVDELFAVLNEGQRDALFGAAWAANQDGTIPFSLAASEPRRSFGPK